MSNKAFGYSKDHVSAYVQYQAILLDQSMNRGVVSIDR